MKLNAALAASIMAMLITTGCAQRGPIYGDGGYQRGGPPPHAPAHGYRHKQKNHQMRYDSALGVYVLLDLIDHYYFDDRYYRYRGGDWQYARELEGDRWRDADRRSIPEQLYRQYSHNAERPGRGRGNGPPKGRGKGRGNN